MLKKTIKYLIRRLYISDLFHFFLVKTGIIKKFGLLGFGEARENRINPFYMTLNVIDSDYKMVFDENSKLPFKDNSLNMVYSAHNLEHLNYKTAENFFEEAYRVLKPEGELSIEVPDNELVYNEYKKSLKTKDFKFFDDNMGFDWSDEVLYNIKKNQKIPPEILTEYMKDPSVKVSNCIASYCEPEFTGAHTPFVLDPKIFNHKFESLKMDDFFSWYTDFLSIEQKNSGGHISSWYPEKLINILSKKGFNAKQRKYKESRRIKSNFFIFVPDREHRTNVSFRISAIK